MPSSHTYAAVKQEEEASAAAPFLERESDDADSERANTHIQKHMQHNRLARCRTWMSSPIWAATTTLLLAILIVQNAIALGRPSYDSGFATELSALRPFITLRPTRFTGAIRDTPSGNLSVPVPAVDEQGRRFTGPPSPDIDAAWADLIYGRYVSLSNSEVDWLNKDTGIPPLTFINMSIPGEIEPGYYGGPDMLHSLHCLNGLRKHALDPEYYASDMVIPEWGRRMHIEHCLEQLRQAVLCHGDLTPVTLKPVVDERDGKVWALLGETEREHVCRDGVGLARQWRRIGGDKGYFNSD